MINVVPILIPKLLWKKRNTILHGDDYHERKIFWEVDAEIIRFIKYRFKMEIPVKD